ncbi:MAG: hypothetical protein GC134_08885 [Proteobacteria bacterium]|nr:hypothetical protein [Pseudomonadota bacterium]
MLARIAKSLKCQRGNFSPFMIGLVLGLAVFSTAMRKQAERELAKIEAQQAEAKKKQLQELKDGVENALLMETAANFNNGIDATRIRNSTSASLDTRNGQAIVINSTAMDNATGRQRVMISNSDDAFIRADASTSTDANMLTSDITKRDDVAVIDTSVIRARQLEISKGNMAALTDFVYDWWRRAMVDGTAESGTHHLPTNGTFNTDIRDVYTQRDFWGNNFTYARATSQTATISFTTPAPWSETYTDIIDMREASAAAGAK